MFEKIWNCKGINHNLNVGIFKISGLPEHVKRIVKPIHPKNTDEWPDLDDDFAFESDEESNNDDPRWVHQSEAVALFSEIKMSKKPRRLCLQAAKASFVWQQVLGKHGQH